ncbi:hypothetical protein [Lentibacillus sediminis]|nr:hypothetical protein [Lentibacillus sediminis]
MLGEFDGLTFNHGVVFVVLIALLIFGTVAGGNVIQDPSQPQQTL